VARKYLSDAKKSFDRAHVVLIKTSFFKRVMWETGRNGWSIKYFPGNRATDEYEQYRVLASDEVIEQLEMPISLPEAKKVGERQENMSETHFEAPEGHSADSQTTQLAQMLIERGIRPRPAGELAKKFPDRIPHAVEVFDFLCSQPDNQIKSKPAFLRKAVEEHWFRDASSLPEGFVSKEEQEDERRSREQARQDLRVEYRQAQAKVKAEVGDWADLSPEQRISGRLDLWIMEFRRRHGKNPSEDEERRRSEKYIQELPTQEQMLTNQLNDLRRQFEQKAKEQGIEDIHFHATEEVHS